MIRTNISEFKKHSQAHPEQTALLRKLDNKIYLLSDIEYGGDNEQLQIEWMHFELDTSIPFDTSLLKCRDEYAGGITYPLENCESFEICLSEFIEQSSTNEFWLIDNENWSEISTIDFYEAFVTIDTNNVEI